MVFNKVGERIVGRQKQVPTLLLCNKFMLKF